MAPRATWKGYLKLSLVSCPVRLYNATSSSNRVSFHLLHKQTHNRIRMVPHDPELGPVDREDLVKGYEYQKDQYIIIEPADLDKIKIESSDALTIERFVDEHEVDPIYFDSPYYLAPDGTFAEEAFRVIHGYRQGAGAGQGDQPDGRLAAEPRTGRETQAPGSAAGGRRQERCR